MEADTRTFVSACTICARGKSSHRRPSGLVQLPPVPGRTWSHIALNFVAKAVHFVALSKLPCGSTPWYPTRHCVGPGCPVHISGSEGVLLGSGHHREPFFWFPTPVKWSNRERGRIRTSRPLCAVSLLPTPPPGALISPGSDTLKAHSPALPQVCPLLKLLWDISHLCFSLRRAR